MYVPNVRTEQQVLLVMMLPDQTRFVTKSCVKKIITSKIMHVFLVLMLVTEDPRVTMRAEMIRLVMFVLRTTTLPVTVVCNVIKDHPMIGVMIHP
jgi:hypothetical protein